MIEFTAKKEYELPMTKSELAEMFKVSERTINREMSNGKIGFVMIAGRARFMDHHIQEYIRSNETGYISSENQMAANAS
jgi:excisionase family DNA binding protein